MLRQQVTFARIVQRAGIMPQKKTVHYMAVAALAMSVTACGPIPVGGSSPEQWARAWDKCLTFRNGDSPRRASYVTENRELSIEIDAPTDQVWDFYSEPLNHRELQPLVLESVEHNRYLDGNGNTVIEYSALEDVPLGPFTLRNAVHAIQVVDRDSTQYTVDTCSAFNIMLHLENTVEDLGGDTTRVTENIEFFASGSTIDLTVREGISAHEGTLSTLKRLMEMVITEL